MRMTRPAPLLAADDPAPFAIERSDGASPFVLICDHAGRAVPRALGDLGVPAPEWERHIAWDIGAAGVARHLAQALDAFLITQTYSRLVIDCNRPAGSPTRIPERSENTPVPGNLGLDDAQRAARVRGIFEPYHAAIAAELDRRQAAGLPTILVSMHSFTEVYDGVPRPWHLGMLHQQDTRMSDAMLALIRADGRWVAGDNEPYAISDTAEYSIPTHGQARGLPYVEIEVRQDLIADAPGQADWAARLADWLQRAAATLGT
ncbi:N-formylglutamate amidohydrolase [Coralloluteibacterium stylophorae]|uniref:N-formylglutamate amidohydrolase n=1 Tax=Coralloluteibacterium stylophorae TaxID=1776034 RepID=A0A8J8AYW9_9GAMM|nr:N-formylglutamate amidohydrolase [Coralloluteibacterium stylophorae]MBS7456508.1 N-formylglutamate amidohydrolase [Coralloluteibacterium stylophorae]